MTTLYEEFIGVRTSKNNWSYKPDIQKKLVDIFKIICDIDLSNETEPFKPDGGSFGMEIVYNYKFKYGRVYVKTEKKKMQVMFIFDNPHDLIIPFSQPSRSNRCTVNVDNDLNFVESSFGFYTSFSNRTIDKNSSGFLILCFERINDGIQLFNSVTYSQDMQSDDYLDLVQYKLNKNYLIPNIEFEQIFIKFMTFCSEFPENFYNIFIEYPNYQEIISNIDKIVLFLNLFNKQYHENKELLAARLLLVDMTLI